MGLTNDQCDYINASWITTAKSQDNHKQASIIGSASNVTPCSNITFMACQGPLANTCVHHLQMIHEQKIDIVVMLTRLEEATKGNII